MLPFMDDDKDDAMAIAKMVKENMEPEVDHAQEAKKVAVQKMMNAFRTDDVESVMTAMAELKEIES